VRATPESMSRGVIARSLIMFAPDVREMPLSLAHFRAGMKAGTRLRGGAAGLRRTVLA